MTPCTGNLKFGEMELGEMKLNTSNWSSFCKLPRRAGLSASAGVSCYLLQRHCGIVIELELCSIMRLRYLQSGGNNPEILLYIAGMEQDAIALAQKNGDVNAKHQKDLGK